MKKPLTSKQKLILSLVKDLTNKRGSAPTLDEIRELLNYANISSVQRHTEALKSKGYLKDMRGLELPNNENKVQIPLVGNVACGTPLLATENIEAYILVDADGVKGRPEEYFFLRAVGDSMNNTNISGKTIEDGDFILIKKQNHAERGNRIVALIGDEATVKKYVPESNCVKLEPESTNLSNKPIIVFDEILIQGVVYDVMKEGGE